MGKNGAPEAPENAAQCICGAGIEPPKTGGSRCKQLRPMGSFRVGRRNYGHRQLWPMTIERKRNFRFLFHDKTNHKLAKGLLSTAFLACS